MLANVIGQLKKRLFESCSLIGDFVLIFNLPTLFLGQLDRHRRCPDGLFVAALAAEHKTQSLRELFLNHRAANPSRALATNDWFKAVDR